MQTKARTTFVTADDLRAKLALQIGRNSKPARGKAKTIRNGKQAELARQLNVSAAFFSQFLNGQRSISREILSGLGYDPTPHYKPKANNDQKSKLANSRTAI